MFLPSCKDIFELAECRGTSKVSGREVVQVQEFTDTHWCSVAVQVVSEPVNSHGVEILMLVEAGSWVIQQLQICHGSRSGLQKP